MFKSSIEIYNELHELNDQLKVAQDAFNAAEGDAKDFERDKINRIQGRKEALNDMLGDVLNEEDKVRKGGGMPLVSTVAKKSDPVNFIDAFLGPRADFDASAGIFSKLGEKMAFGYDQVFNADPDATYKLADPKKTNYALPENIIEMPMGVIDVISKGVTDSNMEYFVPGAFTNSAAEWTPGNVKARSDESWAKDEASLFTVAHHMPISKHTAYHYPQLRTVIGNDLMTGLRLKEADALLNLNSSTSKQGILNKTGIQNYTAKAGDTLYDSIRRMKTLSWMGTGIFPNYIAIHPMVSEHLDLMKTTDGSYMLLTINGRTWGVPIVEDVNLVSGDAGSEKYGALLFNSNAATWYTSESDALSIGFVNDQFIRNEYTLLAEGEHLITVQRPKSFVHLADALTEVPAVDGASTASAKASK